MKSVVMNVQNFLQMKYTSGEFRTSDDHSCLLLWCADRFAVAVKFNLMFSRSQTNSRCVRGNGLSATFVITRHQHLQV